MAELVNSYAQSQQDDPKSPLYKRQLVRPRIPVLRIVLLVLLGLAVCAVVAVGIKMLTHSVLWAILAGLGALVLICGIFAKFILIWAVKIYQAIAPERVRMRCRYEPSCSVYMILCLEKYGFWKGLKKGLNRWGGCKPPNGGFDWPE